MSKNKSMKVESFSSELRDRLKAIDIDPKELKPIEIYKRLGLSPEQISYETLRKILSGKASPSEHTKSLLRKVTESDHTWSASGKYTRELVRGLLESGAPYFIIKPQGEVDLVLESRLAPFPGYRHLVRCLDDDRPNSDEQTYILKHALAAHTDIKNLDCASATLLTHLPLPPNEPVKLSSQVAKDVSIVTVAEFVSRFLNLEKCKAELTSRLKAHGIGAEGTDSSVFYGYDNKGEIVNCLEEIQKISGLVGNKAEDPTITPESAWRVCVIAGMPGTGKTTLCLTAALTILKSYTNENGRTADVCFPVILRGRDILTPQHIPGAIKDAIETLYGANLPQTIVDEMIGSGYLLLFIDGLNESVSVLTYSHLTSVLGHLPHAFKEESKYILTLRPGTLTLEEQETAINSKTVTWRSLDAPDQHDWNEEQRRQSLKESRKKLEKPLGMYILNQLETSDEIARPLLELARIPLFIQALSSEKGKSFLNDLLSTTLTEEGIQARNETFYRLVEFLTSRWSAQVLGGISDPDNQGVTRAREEDFAKLLVQSTGTSFLLAWDRGNRSMNMMLSYDELIERLDVKGTSLHKDKDEERKALSERMLKASALLERSKDKCRLRLPAGILRDFFLAQYFVDGMLRDSLQNQEEEIIKRLGQAPLHWEQRLVSYFVAGRLRVANRQNLITDLLKEVAVKSSQNSLLKELLLAQPGKSYLLQNLIFLHVASQLHGTDTCIDISEVSIAGADLSHALDHINANTITIKAHRSNLEFVRLTSRSDVYEQIKWADEDEHRLDKPLWRGPLPTKADVPALIDYCRETKAHKPEFDQSNEWLVVPGGVYTVGSYKDRSKHESNVQEPSELIGPTRIGLTSFAIQLNPITNRDFLRFLRQPGNEKWSWKVQRPETTNDYYLRGWDAMIKQFDDKDVKSWNEKDIKEGWLEAPLVYVSWMAANAYARFYGLSLPTEAQFEVAARYFYHREKAEEDSVREYPWWNDLVERGMSDVSADKMLTGYALYGEKEDDNPSLYPPFGVSDDDKLDNFKQWASEVSPVDLPEIRPARHLLGGVRQWMADIWSPIWPPYKEKLEGIIIHPYQDGWAATEYELGYEQRKRWRQERHRVLRGGSYHWTAKQLRISYRDAQRETNVNHDVGFRCVKRIWPTKSLEPSA
jgi:formylglycine-generating enzyme required for sulfatase activity